MSYRILTSNVIFGDSNPLTPNFSFRVLEQNGGILMLQNDGGSTKFQVNGYLASETVELDTMIPSGSNVTIQGDMKMEGNVEATGNVQVDQILRLKEIDPLQQGNLKITGNVLSIDAYTSASDQRLKTNILTIGDAMGKIRKLEGVEFEWRDDIPGMPYRGKDVGVIAQQVAALGYDKATSLAPFDVDPSGRSISGNNYLTVDTGNRLTAILIQAVKELDDRVQSIEKKMLDTGI